MSAYPAHVTRRPTLADLMTNPRTNPAKLQTRLGRVFKDCRVMWAIGAAPFQFALECRDKRDALRMLVLFFWNEEGWTYQPVSRQGAKRIRLENPL